MVNLLSTGIVLLTLVLEAACTGVQMLELFDSELQKTTPVIKVPLQQRLLQPYLDRHSPSAHKAILYNLTQDQYLMTEEHIN